MATRTRSTPVSSPSEAVSSSETSRPSSPTSQLLMSRREEKVHMQNLNDRLASLIERQRQLEVENQQLSTRIEKSEETYYREVSTIKTVYEKQLEDTRSQLDLLSNENARLHIEAERAKADHSNLLGQLNKQTKDLSALEKKLVSVESELNHVKHALHEEQERRKRVEEDRNMARKEVETSGKQLAAAQKQLEAETLARIEAENSMKTLRERMVFEKSVHEEELNQSRMSSSEVVETQVQQLQEELQAQKAIELQELREEAEERFTLALNDLEVKYETQIDQLKATLAARADGENKLRADLSTASSRVQSYESKIHSLETNVRSLKDRIKDLEEIVNQERTWNAQGLEEKDRAISHLQDQLKQQLQEYKELYDVKVGLDMEIGTYRKLVEGEERRLSVPSISPSSPSLSSRSSFLGSSPLNVSRGSKRKVVFEEVYESDIHTDAHTNCDIEISDHDAEGSFVTLRNKGKTDVSLSGWQLVRKSGAGGEVKTSYKFHRNVVVKPKATVTIWSASSKKEHNPPSDLLMKSQNWFTAEEMATVLLDNNSDQMAIRETKRTNKARKRRLTGDPLPPSSADDPRCSIM